MMSKSIKNLSAQVTINALFDLFSSLFIGLNGRFGIIELDASYIDHLFGVDQFKIGIVKVDICLERSTEKTAIRRDAIHITCDL